MAPRKAAPKPKSSPERPSDAISERSPSKRKRSSQKNVKRHARKDVEESGEDELDSDALDESDDDRWKKKKKAKTSASTSASASTPKRVKRQAKKTDSDDDEDAFELEEGQEIVGKVVKAPTTGLVPPGQISQNTLNFLTKLKDPECNDRQWFKLHDPVYRAAEKEWKSFIEAFTDVLIQVDPEIPPLPPKDVVHRIYRDIRFSNDKTPYKQGFSASFSRSGRKGIFAGLQPGHQSLIAAGSWCPARAELSTIRSNILRNSTPLRQIISSPTFEKLFGKATPDPNGERTNIFGREDELKTAPKGVDKAHKDIDLLKCRSFAVVYQFIDSDVLDPDFKNKIGMVAQVMQPFVHCLNDMMTVVEESEDEEGGGEGSEEDEDEDEDEE